MMTRLFTSLSLLFVALALAGCHSLPPSKPEALWTVQEGRGAIAFHSYCAKCHYPNTTHALHGPGLQALYKQKYLPSGAPANDDRITQTILHGRAMMPATKIDDDQLQDLLAYLHTL